MKRNILREIVRLGWPVFIAQIAVMANGLIDTVMAGRYGTLDLAAVGIGASIYVTLFVTLMGVLFALTPIAAQLYGAGRHAEIGEEIRQSLWLGAWLSCISLTLLALPEPLLAVARLTPEVEARTRDYLHAIAWGVPAAFALRVFQGFSTAISRPRVVMALNLVGLALKVPLNWALMYGKLGLPPLGAAGCGLATSIISWVVCALAWLWCFVERDYARFKVFERWSWPRLRAQWQLVALGVPIGMTFLVDVTAFTFMALFIARSGPLYSGAHQIAANLAALCFMLPLALGNATSVLVGQAIGARDARRARRTGLIGVCAGLAVGVVVGAAIFIGAEHIVALYTEDRDVQRVAATLLMFVAVYHVGDAAQAVAVNALRAYKRAVVPLAIYAVALWGIGLGGGYLLGTHGLPGLWAGAPLGAQGYWLAAVVGMLLTGLLGTLYFLRVSRVGSAQVHGSTCTPRQNAT